MWLRYLLLLCGLLLVLCDDAVISAEETVGDVADREDEFDVWVVAHEAVNQDSGESNDDDRDLNTDDDFDEPADEDLNDEKPADEDLNDEEPADEDLNDEEPADEDLNDEEPADEDLNDEEPADEDLNDEEPANEDLNDEKPADKDLNDDDDDAEHTNKDLKEGEDVNDVAKDSNGEQNQTTTNSPETVQTVTLPETKGTVIKRPNVSTNKKGHATNKKGNRLARIGENLGGKPANSKSKKAGVNSAKTVGSSQTSTDSNWRNSREGALRKKRLPPNSASPSVTVIIIVVGAVLACVLITGFIRWRVRKRIRDKKLGKMDNLAAYRSRMGLAKTSIMDTIYECECEDRLTALRAQNIEVEVHDVEDSLDGAKTKQEELFCSHRFDEPPSMASSRHYDDDSYRSSKGEEEFGRVYGSKKHSKGHKKHHHHHHHSHKSRYSRHHRKKSHYRESTETFESISPTNVESAEENLDEIDCSTSLLEPTETTEVKRSVTENQPGILPAHFKQSNQHQQRGPALGQLPITWQSLSFNRDWVGRMWQEKHNVRRISDVLRNMTISSSLSSEGSSSDTQTSDEDVQNQSAEATPAGDQQSTLITIPDDQNNGETDCPAVGDIASDSTVITLFNSEDVPENPPELSGLNDRSAAETSTSGTADDVAETLEASISPSQGGSMPAFLSLGDCNEEPPEYESLLESQSYSHHSTPLVNIEHHRHHRRHHRKGRERSHRHVYTRVPEFESSREDTRDPSTPLGHEEHTPPTNDYKSHEILSNHRLESQSLETPVTTPMCSSNNSEDPNTGHHSFTNSPSGHTVSSVAAPFVQQEGIVLEQLSDGSQIIYLPPPILPCYFNDTPPPYHK